MPSTSYVLWAILVLVGPALFHLRAGTDASEIPLQYWRSLLRDRLASVPV